jgi:predicted Ser/Thr protein kinase
MNDLYNWEYILQYLNIQDAKFLSESEMDAGRRVYLHNEKIYKITNTHLETTSFWRVNTLQQEYEILIKCIRHPSVPNPISFTHHQCFDVLIMDRIEGALLSDSSTNFNTLARVNMNLCKALYRLSLLGVAHNDLRPSNIIVDNNFKVYLIDFDQAVPTNFFHAISLNFGGFNMGQVKVRGAFPEILSYSFKKLRYYLKFTNPVVHLINRICKTDSCYITCAGKSDGGGAQVHAMMSTMAFAHKVGVNYAHSPFCEIAHNSKGDNEWELRWEDFFNLGRGEVLVGDLDVTKFRVVHLKKARRFKRRRKTLYVIPHCHDFCDNVPNVYRDIQKSFIHKYETSQSSEMRLNDGGGGIEIAVHVRRGDVSQGGDAKRYTDNHVILSRLNNIKRSLTTTGEKVSIRVYSQGEVADFQEFLDMGATLHLNEDVFVTLNHLISADILLMAKSSMSYCAALLSKSIVVYEPFWHQPMSHWMIVSADKVTDWSLLASRLRNK